MGGIAEDTRLAMLEAEVKALGEDYYLWFLDMLANGQTVTFAHMAVFQEAPTMKDSDRTFNAESRYKMNRMDNENRRLMVEKAEKAGIRTHGKYYVGGLGTYTDPHAWVSSADDVLHVCKKKNLTASGMVNHKGSPVDPPKRPALADDIAQRLVAERLSAEPRTRERLQRGRTSLHELKEEAVARHGRPRSE